MTYEATHTFRDGGTVTGSRETVDRAIRIERALDSKRDRLVVRLRAQGVKAAHPDDGWVDRERSRIHLCYPYFNDGLGVGDLLALDHWRDGPRIVRIIGSEDNRFAPWERPWYWLFKSVPMGED